ncbi:MAG: archease [Deltaproteobacteria bacterium]|nr:archease [Deltaproteobacteria bacterium]
MPRYRLIDHTADLTVYFYGQSPEEVFINAGQVMFELMLDGRPDGTKEERRLEITGVDREDVLVQWLSELLFLYAGRNQALFGVEIKTLSLTGMKARLELVSFDPEIMGVKTEIKAVTYHQAEFKPTESGWRARVTFDL